MNSNLHDHGMDGMDSISASPQNSSSQETRVSEPQRRYAESSTDRRLIRISVK